MSKRLEFFLIGVAGGIVGSLSVMLAVYIKAGFGDYLLHGLLP